MKVYIVDAFAEELFGGNPAGVAILDGGADFPKDEIMRKTAAELRYSETVFIKQLNKQEFEARYFTPTEEVDLCGHATIGAFGCLLEEGTVKRGQRYFLFTKAGRLEIEMKEDAVFMEMGTAVDLGAVENIEEVAEILGISIDEIGMTPKLISTGLPDIMVPIKTKEPLMKMKPDFVAMAMLSQKMKAVGMHAFCLSEEKGIKAICRNFAPLYGIEEEAATGTSNAALAYYLYKEKMICEGETNTFLQGESMDRPSKILVRIDKQEKLRIWVGGSYKILVKGDLFV